VARSEVPRRGTRQPARPGPVDTRERIVKEATRLFAKKGYHHTGVAEIGREVGLGAGALYNHIGSKEELLFEICRRHIEEIVEFGEDLLVAQLPPAEKIRRLAHKHMQEVAERGAEMRVALREVDSLTGQRRREMKALRDRTEEIWEHIAEDGRTAGDLGGLDPFFVKALLGALNYAALWYHSSGLLSPQEVADRTVVLLSRGRVTT
jgi:TetR/AcrR family transcriptional regulator, cholesterol catabolism regulator